MHKEVLQYVNFIIQEINEIKKDYLMPQGGIKFEMDRRTTASNI